MSFQHYHCVTILIDNHSIINFTKSNSKNIISTINMVSPPQAKFCHHNSQVYLLHILLSKTQWSTLSVNRNLSLGIFQANVYQQRSCLFTQVLRKKSKDKLHFISFSLVLLSFENSSIMAPSVKKTYQHYLGNIIYLNYLCASLLLVVAIFISLVWLSLHHPWSAVWCDSSCCICICFGTWLHTLHVKWQSQSIYVFL